jgi:hypothetical protein
MSIRKNVLCTSGVASERIKINLHGSYTAFLLGAKEAINLSKLE